MDEAKTVAQNQDGSQEKRNKLWYLSLLAIGVVYGDIGTSPLYAIRECFYGPHRIGTTPENIFGILSLVFWSLILVITIKYLLIILRADHDGEGGILALMELVRPGQKGMKFIIISTLGIFGAALLYGDGMITPAISVLSAVEGLEVATPFFKPFIIPVTIIILIGLFLFQKKGTSLVGSVFGPITVIWFLTIATLGLSQIVTKPGILAALNPYYAINFFAVHGVHGLIVLGVVFLVVTGGEALYADIGHFGKAPIRLAWFTIVLPCLVMNYFGQGALLLKNPSLASNPFYLMAPSWMLYPLVILATLATIIASQAVISGAFSLTFQAINLGYLPRFVVKHTSVSSRGQIFLPQVNNFLMVATILVVLGFQTSSNLASAYGLAVTMTMAITSILAFIAMNRIWKWGLLVSALITTLFLTVDLSFLGSNLTKIADGGWLPLLVGIAGVIMMRTWRKGRQFLALQISRRATSLEDVVADFENKKYRTVGGTAVYLAKDPYKTPLALMQNLKHNKVMHEQILILTAEFMQSPRVNPVDRFEIEKLDEKFYRVIVKYGFMEQVDIDQVMKLLRKKGLSLNLKETTYILSRETLVSSSKFGMNIWQDALFSFMSRNSQRATAYFNVPRNRVFEIGTQITI
ncbi:MAG TPA: potassium transporter Kup [Balneolaceae bacterium]|nr:potassium transporter Kup [Balneolaceae bacterium]